MDKRILWLAAMFCSALLFLMMFVSLGAAERQTNRLVAHVGELEQQVYDRDEIIAAQQRLIAAYQEQNMAVAGVLGQASDALEGIAYGPYTREEIQAKIMAVADVIAEVNHILTPDQVQAISHSIVTCSVAADIDPMLLTAMAITESDCRPKARGRAGEYGMLQVMPETGRWIAGRLGYADYRPEQMLGIRTNVQFAAYYLKVVTREFGDVWTGVLAYNRGSSGAKAWLKGHDAGQYCYVRKVNKIYREAKQMTTNDRLGAALDAAKVSVEGKNLVKAAWVKSNPRWLYVPEYDVSVSKSQVTFTPSAARMLDSATHVLLGVGLLDGGEKVLMVMPVALGVGGYRLTNSSTKAPDGVTGRRVGAPSAPRKLREAGLQFGRYKLYRASDRLIGRLVA